MPHIVWPEIESPHLPSLLPQAPDTATATIPSLTMTTFVPSFLHYCSQADPESDRALTEIDQPRPLGSPLLILLPGPPTIANGADEEVAPPDKLRDTPHDTCGRSVGITIGSDLVGFTVAL